MEKLLLASLFFVSLMARAEIENVFSTPGFKGQYSFTIENKLIEMTRMAVPGSTIRAALYSFDRVALANELVAASKRGVDVRLVMDGGNKVNIDTQGHAINILAHELQCAPGTPCVHFCEGPLASPLAFLKIKKGYPLGGSCRGLVINHNKLFLFSQLSDGHFVVAQTSANMNQSQLAMYQDMLLIKDDPALFSQISNYWVKLLTDRTVLKDSYPTIESTLNPVRVHFFPRLTGKDPVLDILRRVNCKIPGSTIRVAHAAFTRGKVAEEMKRLRDEGCGLQVILREDPAQSSPGGKVRKLLGQSLLVLPFNGDTPAKQSINSIHTKIVLINASIDNSSEKVQLTLTGSHNLDLFSLRTNDEMLFEVRDAQMFERYDKFLDQILFDARAAGIDI